MYEFDVIDIVENIPITTIYGYSESDALRRCPKYDSDRYYLTKGIYID